MQQNDVTLTDERSLEKVETGENKRYLETPSGQILTLFSKYPNRLSSTRGGNREMDQLYTTSQASNIPRKTKFSQIH